MNKLKVLLVFLIIVLIGGLACTGCTTTEEPAKVFELKMATHTAPEQATNVVATEWIKKLEERTDGRVKVTLYPAATLGKFFDEWMMVQQGVSDIGWIIAPLFPQDLPLFGLGDLPFAMPGVRDLDFLNTLADGYLNEQFESKGVKVLWPCYLGINGFFTVDKQIKTLDDFKGLTLSIPSEPISRVWIAWGATPVQVPPPETATTLERKMIDGLATSAEKMLSEKTYELVKYGIDAGLTTGMGGVVMNGNIWDSFPSDIQDVFEELSPWAQQAMTDAFDADDEKAWVVFEEYGMVIYDLPPAERAKWADSVAFVVDEWAADMDAKGYRGTELLEEARRLMAEMGK